VSLDPKTCLMCGAVLDERDRLATRLRQTWHLLFTELRRRLQPDAPKSGGAATAPKARG
jgi:hypothetical protein